MPENKTVSVSRRDLLLDRLKGIGIMLVIFAHICFNRSSFFIFLFHMPLFFFLSGASLSYSKNLEFKTWVRFKRIMVPYFGFSLLCFAYWYFLESKFRPVQDVSLFSGLLGSLDFRLQQLANIPLAISYNEAFQYNVVLWFLPCLFVSVLLFIAIKKLLGQYAPIGVLATAVIGFLLRNTRLPWGLEIAFTAVPFIWAGYVAYKYLKSGSWWIGIGTLAASVVLVWVFNPHVEMRTHRYGNIFLFYAVALGLIVTLVIAGRVLAFKNGGVLTWLGRNSLTLMCLHGPVYRVVLGVGARILHMEMATLRGSTLLSLGATLVVIGILVPVILGLNKYLPELVGRERIARTN